MNVVFGRKNCFAIEVTGVRSGVGHLGVWVGGARFGDARAAAHIGALQLDARSFLRKQHAVPAELVNGDMAAIGVRLDQINSIESNTGSKSDYELDAELESIVLWPYDPECFYHDTIAAISSGELTRVFAWSGRSYLERTEAWMEASLPTVEFELVLRSFADWREPTST